VKPIFFHCEADYGAHAPSPRAWLLENPSELIAARKQMNSTTTHRRKRKGPNLRDILLKRTG
jgi:hypothetical protein